MKISKYMIVKENLSEKDSVERGRDLFYLCGKCGDSIASIAKETGGCTCGNVFIDKEYFRLCVDDYANFKIIRTK